MYHSRLAELISSKKQEEYATTITWIRTKVSFAILRTALVCLRGTRSRRRKSNVQENDLEIEGALKRMRPDQSGQSVIVELRERF